MTTRPTTDLCFFLRTAAAPTALGALGALGCYLAAGRSLGFYLGPVVAAALLVPPLVAWQARPLAALIVTGSIIDAIGIAWLITVFAGDISVTDWLACYVTLAAVAVALCGGTWAMRRAIGATAAAAVVTVVALVWLTWPLWLSPHLSGSRGAGLVSWLAPLHPLLAINHVLLDLGAWTQQRLMYAHTALGQDVPLALPRSIWPCAIVHLLTGLALLWAAAESSRRRELARPSPAATSAGATEA